MDCMETALLRKEVLRWDMAMPSPAHAGQHHQHLQSPLSSSSAEEDTPCAAIDQSSLLWEDFSVDDLLDFGVQEEQTGGEHEDVEEADEEEERDGCSNPKTSSSALSFPAAPSSSDPIVPAEDAEELEWVSRFVDDSYSEFTSAAMTPPLVDHHAARVAPAKTEAPEARGTRLTGPTKRPWRSSCFSMESVAVPAKTRSKRLRTDGRVWSSFCRPSLLSESSSSLCSSASSTLSCSGSSITSYLWFDKLGGGGGEDADRLLHCLGGGPNSLNQHRLSHPQLKKKKGRKPKPLAGAAAATAGCSGGAEQLARRRCSHCGVDKTPQWRAGPMGAKTLCNACGVRYKSGRLLPEYRPAGSPTFLSHVHSNSHRRVLEIRSNKELVAAAAPVPPPASCSPSPPQLEAATRPYGVV